MLNIFSYRCSLWPGHVTVDALGQVPAVLLVAGPREAPWGSGVGQGTGQEPSSMCQAFLDRDKLKVTSRSRTQVVLLPI